jgi:hypothetical protein
MIYNIKVPPTMEQGSFNFTISRVTSRTVRKEALWDYNSARAHDGLPPVKRMPAGTFYSPVYDYEIQMFTSEEWECVSSENTRKEANISIKEYRENQPGCYRIKRIAAE